MILIKPNSSNKNIPPIKKVNTTDGITELVSDLTWSSKIVESSAVDILCEATENPFSTKAPSLSKSEPVLVSKLVVFAFRS